jgi:starch-binding outer membrane protein, SusD/RagB family
MKNINKKHNILLIVIALITGLTMGSCEDYLDKAPESIITEQDAFSTFFSFQGFVEEMYYCVHNRMRTAAYQDWSPGNESVYAYPSAWDLGDYFSAQSSFLYSTAAPNPRRTHPQIRVWQYSWYGIRKANLALEKLPLMIDATQEERDLIKGQALFFRAFFHFELIKWWGGMPYIDEVLHPAGDLQKPRLTYQETALRIAEDFKAAAELLPLDWDNTVAGQRTQGGNKQRINKIMALSFKGQNLLYAASPLMNESSGGSATFNPELAQRAAVTLGGVINICNTTGRHELEPWENRREIYEYYSPSRQTINGGKEAIKIPPVHSTNNIRWSAYPFLQPTVFNGGSPYVDAPTHSFIKNYRMANGLPIDHPDSGFDPDDPWSNREARFYTDIWVDGDQLVFASSAGVQQYAQLHRGGIHKEGVGGSRTGYYHHKIAPKGLNMWDNRWTTFYGSIPLMTLGNVYLMYAEAVLHGYGTPTSSVPGSITAVQALNTIRNRSLLPDVPAESLASKDAFMQEIMRERTIEFSFEGHRVLDTRRWYVAHLPEYNISSALDFDRGPDGKPINMEERVIFERVFEQKHYWMPIARSFANLYPEFYQNPGW